MNVKVIGAGAWGQSIASVLQENNHTVLFLKRGEIYLEKGDIVVLALPTNAIREALSVAKDIQNLTIINCSKGIERKTHKLPWEIVKELLPATTMYFSLLGPSFAHELQEKMPTLINLGYENHKKDADKIEQLFQTAYLRIHVVKGIASLELAAALKNIYAIACGLATGAGFGMNTRTKIIVSAIGEFYLLANALGYSIDEQSMSGIIGDFILTGNSIESRNFLFGKLLVAHPVEESLQKVHATVEGYYAVFSIAFLAEKAKVKLPLANVVFQMVQQKGMTVDQLFRDFAQTI